MVLSVSIGVYRWFIGGLFPGLFTADYSDVMGENQPISDFGIPVEIQSGAACRGEIRRPLSRFPLPPRVL